MKLSFHGAARTVTGSCHLLECNGLRILVDCGLFQGGGELDEENAADFGFDPASIDFVLLTHAHLDHCGRLPLLAKRGFRGEIIATAATFELARLVILDSTQLQLEDVHHRRAPAHPLCSMTDALDAIGRFGRTAQYERPIELAPGLRTTFFDAGHILGSAGVLVESCDNGHSRSVFFSGDIGNAGRTLLADPRLPVSADVVVMESTYGDRSHRDYAASVEEFYQAIDDTLLRKGNVLIPTFALERTQEILFCLHRAVATRRLPRSLPVFLDSPMAATATEIFRRHPECFAPDIAAALAHGDPFSVPALTLTSDVRDSMAIIRISGGAVILAGSGMCTGGRIRHHLLHNLANSNASVIFVGFAARGTLGRRIIDGERMVRLFGENVAVRAHIHTINGFSCHAGQRELLEWHGRIGNVKRTFLVHGEASCMASLQALLPAGGIEMPALHQSFEL